MLCMIEISDSKNCCGCQACMQVCPKQCISMQNGKDGFCYPFVDASSCVNCGLCNKICPIESTKDITDDVKNGSFPSFAAISRDKKSLMKSSSGGVFKEMAKIVIAEGGYVAGCLFDETLTARHVITNDIAVIDKMRGSKYVQSDTARVYSDIKKFLKNGKKVMFSGTPCQCAALRHTVGVKLSENLLIVDFACHGVPSPVAWKEYLKSLHWDEVSECEMRDKSKCWEKFSFRVKGEKHGKNVVQEGVLKESIWIRGFLSHVYVRPSCYSCQFRNGRNQSDLTISDCWGARTLIPTVTNEQMKNGISSVIVRTGKGQEYFERIKNEIWQQRLKYENVAHFNPALKESHKASVGAPLFFPMLHIGIPFKYSVFISCAVDKLYRIINKVF